MMEWNNELILEFLQLYENHPILWNPKHQGHKNRNSLNDAWVNISREMSTDMPVAELKKKKESLLSTYRSLRKKVQDSSTTGSGSDDIFKPSWFAYDAIDRFIRVTKNKKPSLNSEDEVIGDESLLREQDTINESEDLDQREGIERESARLENSVSNTNIERAKPQFQKSQTITKRKRTTNYNNEQNQIETHLKEATAALHNLSNRRQDHPHQDAAALYGQLLAEKLRKLSVGTRLILQNKIDNLVFEAEYHENVIAPKNVSAGTSNKTRTPSSSSSPIRSEPPSPNPTFTDQPQFLSQTSFQSTNIHTHMSNSLQNSPSSSYTQSSSPRPTPPISIIHLNLPYAQNNNMTFIDADQSPQNETTSVATYYSHFEDN